MCGVFRMGYRLAFDRDIAQEYFLSLLMSSFYCLSVQLLIMIPAVSTNEKYHQLGQCLSHRIPQQDKDLEFEFKKYFNKGSCLTLWKIYTLDRSLIITSLGTLLTYGILIGNLGSDQ
ncbi:hypothetical protein AVEN_176381-1 [Araneus ventricosus]|uniref:Gustatory receptor n=1 Tax=Araneus ventricosus TaxID=182803 RepID=A0A4Y2C7W9_ARAVE|nr:hypothetical protein AVEN_176381-1 [Araneus ventricosus]